MFTIYHNSRCSKSRQTLALLEENDIKPTIIDYLDTPPNAETIESLLSKLGLSVRDIIRNGEESYKALGLSNIALSDKELIDAIVAHPKLLQRPIVVKGDKAVVGRPPENVLNLI
ncbi:MAG: arsenate reductase (glutaredoxin) [Cellvibrionaceae bacterium]